MPFSKCSVYNIISLHAFLKHASKRQLNSTVAKLGRPSSYAQTIFSLRFRSYDTHCSPYPTLTQRDSAAYLIVSAVVIHY